MVHDFFHELAAPEALVCFFLSTQSPDLKNSLQAHLLTEQKFQLHRQDALGTNIFSAYFLWFLPVGTNGITVLT
jgi:hypothetical protein